VEQTKSQAETKSCPEESRIKMRKACLRDFYLFCHSVMGYKDISPEIHGAYCWFLEGSAPRKQAEMPRGFVKTWIGSIAYPIWITLPRTEADEYPIGIKSDDVFYNLGPNMRILIASYVVANAMKMISMIRRTYERNTMLRFLFPEVIPDNFQKVKWSDTEACIKRDRDFTECTFEAGGIGGSTTSRHYDLIIEDDLIYACKDDFSGRELQPNQEDIDKAIGWHKLGMSLLVPGNHTRIHNIGTRWARHDLIDFIRTNEPDYFIFKRSATKDQTFTSQSEPTWPEMYDLKKLDQIRHAQGPFLFATQYLGIPTVPEDKLFKKEWLQFYRTSAELPKAEEMRIFTTIDLSLWSNTKRKGHESRGVVLTCGWDRYNNVWILHYDAARFDPSEIIEQMYKHYKLFRPELIGVESVYYQKSLMHFLHKDMEKRGWLPVRELTTDSSISKDLRIRALEPYAMNLAIHCKPEHEDFIMEFCEYTPDNNGVTKDILDALSYQLQVARPGSVQSKVRVKPTGDIVLTTGTVEEFLQHAWNKGKKESKESYAEYRPTDNPYDDGRVGEMFENPFEG
jgi:hypothetical protein